MQTLSIIRHKYGLKLMEQYFPCRHPVPGNEVQGVDLLLGFCAEHPDHYTKAMKTLMIDLRQEEKEIFAGFRKSYRRDIQAAQGQYVTLIEPAPNLSGLKAFFNAYDELAHQLSLQPCNRAKLTLFAQRRALVLTQIQHPEDQQLLCIHAYIHDGQRTRLLHSVSRYRELGKDSWSRNRIARAHRFLHWHDIKWFKAWGFNYYDLGGLADSEDVHLKNINHFKQGFGGFIHQEYVNARPKNLRGWVAMKLFMRGL